VLVERQRHGQRPCRDERAAWEGPSHHGASSHRPPLCRNGQERARPPHKASGIRSQCLLRKCGQLHNMLLVSSALLTRALDHKQPPQGVCDEFFTGPTQGWARPAGVRHSPAAMLHCPDAVGGRCAARRDETPDGRPVA
jgi:hypothetical protein